MRKLSALMVVTLGLILLTGCGGAESDNKSNRSPAGKTQSGLSDFQLTHGIGPVTEPIEINSTDPGLAAKGESIFKTNCSACHKMSERYVGPALGDVLDRRSPAYVMNMILNPAQMIKEHPEAKKLLAEFMTPMPDQNLQKEEARAIIEYLASVNRQSK